MKKLLLLVIAVFLAAVLSAENVDQVKVRKVAKAFAAQRDRNAAQLKTDIVYSHPMPNKRDAAFYVVNLGDTGFVIVSANDVAHPVIGYSFDRPWPTEGNIPPQITDYLDDLAGQIEAAYQNQPDQATKTEWQELLSINPNNPPQPKGNRTQVGPLLTTTWDQGQYYNAMCPEDANGPDGYALTGCVATAMAQIINYHGYPTSGRGTHSYQSNYGELSVNFANSIYDYTNMPDALTNESSEAQVNAVAKLMSDCGIAVNMGYTSGESGAYDQEARAALINFFKYSPNMSFAEKSFFSTEEWNTMLQTELNASRPVYYSGRGTGGHAFVCDGYNTDGYYHFNFGWSGAGNDSWYLLDAVEPLGMNFNSDQSAILGIVPDSNGNVILGQMQGTSTFVVDEPLEFYHLMGHNQYEGSNYSNSCNSVVTFIPADATNQMVADIMEFEDQILSINDGNGTHLRYLTGGENNDLSPVVSTANALSISYNGNLYYAGFKLCVSQDEGCRMVSNIVSSIDATTIHLAWTENSSATQWQVEYGQKGFSHGSGTFEVVNSNSITIEHLQKFTEYDFYIRSVCSANEFGYWNKITLMVEAPYWQDIVTSQPEGYTLNNETNTVEISSAEGFAWWAKNGCPYDAYLTANIDLSGYKWRPTYSGHNLSGQGYVISNAFLNEHLDDVGLFSDIARDATIDNVGLEEFHVKGHGNRTGGLCGSLRGVVRNCYIKNSVIDGGDFTGGLVGDNAYGTVLNSYANVNLIGARWAGLMIGTSNNGIEKNCYATGSFRQRAYCYNGGIVAYSSAGMISNCYSTEMPMGVAGYVGGTIVTDTSTFVLNGNTCILLNPVSFDGESVSNMLIALNRYVEQTNDDSYCIWTQDINYENDGCPIHDANYVVLCPNVSDVSIQNVKIGDDYAVSVSWTEIGDATQWSIRYRRHDIPNAPYTYVNATDNPTIIQGIPLGYVYDFNIRAICDSEHHSGWSETQYFIVDLLYWTDIVTTQPEGYVEDADGNVELSTAEGMAWFAVKVNGLHGQPCNKYEGKTVKLMANINLDGYRWKPIGGYFYLELLGYREWVGFEGTFDGQNHSISNIYVNDACSNLGLFGYVHHGRIKNTNMVDGYVASIFTQREYESFATPSYAIGGLIGNASSCYEITNCHSSVSASGNGVGSLLGRVSNYNDNLSFTTIINNCSASGTVYGRESCGGLIGDVYGDVLVCNCFAVGDVDIASGNGYIMYRGGLIGLCQYSSFYNNYSIGEVTYGEGKVIGSPCNDPKISYVYSQDDINLGMDLIGGRYYDNTAQFHHEGSTNSLLTSISIDGTEYSNLLDALNAWVTWQYDQTLKTWVLDSETGYPVLGDYFEPSCYNPTNLIVSQATIVGNATIRTELSWIQTGEPDHWEVLYVAAEHNIDEGVIVSVNSNPCILTDIPVGQPLDFYVRAVCGDNDKSNWNGPVTYIPDILHWTEVVTTQPDGYVEDDGGNVYISTAEGLAWLSSVSNGLNGVPYDQYRFYDKHIVLLSDVDLSAYRWTPIAADWMLKLDHAIVDGNSHVISGLYCNELEDNQGLFGYYWYGSISNIVIKQCDVYGENYSGVLAGQAYYVDITNCATTGNVYGIESVGGITGKSNGSSIRNSYYIGTASSRTDITKTNSQPYYNGGICGVPNGSTIINCYVVSEISDEFDWSGIITSTANCPEIVSNCYYKAYETTLPITCDCTITSNNSSFSGSGSTWTLNTSPYVNGAFRTDLLDALNAWVDANNTNGEYLHWVADTENQNGGFPMLEQLPAQEYQIQQLASGWNWYSTYIEQNDADGLSMIESGLGSHGELIMSRTGAMVENFEGSFWWGDLNAVTNEEMYEIKTNAQTNVVMTGGKATPSSHPITVAPGWNWIGYVSNTSNSIDNTLSSLTSNEDDIIQSRNAFSSYFPGYGWYGDLENMTPGQGYMYKSNGTVSQTLVYPTASRSNESEAIVYHNQADYNRYRNVMDVMAKVFINGEPANSSRYELAAFVDGECRGRAKLQYVEPIETYLAFITINGNEGEEIAFRLYDEDRAETYEADDSNIVLFKPNEVIGKFRAPYIIRFSNAETERTTLFTIYPNPVDKDTEFTIDIPMNENISEVIITNSVGSIIRDERALKGNVLKGLTQSGVYNIQIITEKGNNYRGRVIVK